jgi:hypothetical protein
MWLLRLAYNAKRNQDTKTGYRGKNGFHFIGFTGAAVNFFNLYGYYYNGPEVKLLIFKLVCKYFSPTVPFYRRFVYFMEIAALAPVV